MAKSKVGRPKGPNYEAIRERVVTLKATVNPKSKRQYTFEEIGKLLKMSGMGARRYVRDITGACPQCLRKLRVETKPKAKKP